MEDHNEIMLELCAHRSNRILKREVAKLSYEGVQAELQARGLNREGTDLCLRDRLLRRLIMDDPLMSNFVPWYPNDVEIYTESRDVHSNAAADGRSSPNSVPPRESEQIESRRMSPTQPASDEQRRYRADSQSSGASTSSRHQSRMSPTMSPVLSVPVSASTATTTTMSNVITSVSTHMTLPVLGKQLFSGNVQLPNVTPTARVAISQVRGYWVPLPNQFEYYSAERVRGIRQAPGAAFANSAQVTVKPSPFTPLSRLPKFGNEARSKEQWYTPAQNPANGSDGRSTTSQSDDEHSSYHRPNVNVSRDAGLPKQNVTFVQKGPHNDTPIRVSRNVLREPANRQSASSNNEGSQDQVRQDVQDEAREKNQDRASKTSRLSMKSYAAKAQLHRRDESRRDSSESSDSEPDDDFLPRQTSQRAKKSKRRNANASAPTSQDTAIRKKDKSDVVKLLKSWGLHFSGESSKEEPEEFIEQLDDCLNGSGVETMEIFFALPCIFTKRASRWYRTIRESLTDWDEFKRKFRSQFIGEYDREDLIEDLRSRTQAKGELISNYLADFNYIVSRFKKPPSERRLVERVWRNLLPEYRKAMADKIIDSLADVEYYGHKWEKQRDLDSRYAPPKAAERMTVRGAAYNSHASKTRVAAVEEEPISVSAATHSSKKGIDKKKKQVKEQPSIRAAAAPPAVTPAMEPRPRPVAYCSYANVVQGVQPASNWSKQPARFEQQRGPFQTQWKKSQQWSYGAARQPPTSAAAPAANSRVQPSKPTPADATHRTDFYGACFTCHSVGHRASECPEIECYWCRGKGHSMRTCPHRRQPTSGTESCQNCGAAGVTFKTCPACVQLLQQLGNGPAGDQKK